MYGPAHQFETECDGRAVVCSRIRELQETLSAGTIALEISSRNARVQALQNRWDKMRRVIDERAASPDFADVPGGTTGLLCNDYKGKVADTVVYKVDTGLLAELRGHERQAAEELGAQFLEPGEEKPLRLDRQQWVRDLEWRARGADSLLRHGAEQ
jgi:hypothetical protein